jgi:hypothetical protein
MAKRKYEYITVDVFTDRAFSGNPQPRSSRHTMSLSSRRWDFRS